MLLCGQKLYLVALSVMGMLTLLSLVVLQQEQYQLAGQPRTRSYSFATSTTRSKSTAKTRAVIHMGIPKTGTTSIQKDASILREELKKDGYEIPWVVKQESNMTRRDSPILLPGQKITEESSVNFATCFTPTTERQRMNLPCDPDLLLKGIEIAQRGMNLYVSSEIFCNIDSAGVRDLSAYLKQWDETYIVVYYRRFYSWFASYYNQWVKDRKWSDQEQSKWNNPLNTYLHKRIEGGYLPDATASDLSLIDNEYSKKFAIPLLERLRPHFPNIVVVDYHDKEKGDSSESFYCHAMPSARHTCKSIRSSASETVTNKGQDMAFSDIVFAAWKKGMADIRSDARFKEIVNAAQAYAEDKLHIDAERLPKICPASDDLQKLWDLSWKYEQIFHQRYLGDGYDEDAIKEDFKVASQTYLCATDVDAILSEPQWQSFFESFQVDSSRPPPYLHFCTKEFPFKESLNDTEFQVYYQCEGEKYEEFTAKMWDYAVHNLTTGRQPDAFPANSTVLAIGNSHTRQTMNALVCQYGESVTKVRQWYNSPGTLREVNFNNGATLIYATNTPLFYTEDWERDVLRGIFGRKLSDFDALILGNFNPLPSAEDLEMYEFARIVNTYMQEHSELNFNMSHVPTFDDLALKFPGPITYVSMFAEFSVIEMTEIAERVIGSSDRKDLAFVRGRKHIDALQNECGTDGHFEMGVCLNRGDKHSYGQLVENMHRCNGPRGSHADLVAWDVVASMHQLLDGQT